MFNFIKQSILQDERLHDFELIVKALLEEESQCIWSLEVVTQLEKELAHYSVVVFNHRLVIL
jgi:hypothetical protein